MVLNAFILIDYMVYVDTERLRLVNFVTPLEAKLETTKFFLFCYDNRQKLSEYGLSQGKAYAFATLDDVLVSEKSIEKCVFDGFKLESMAPILGESSSNGKKMIHRTIYECKKCKVRYLLPLTKRDDRARELRQKQMVFVHSF